MSTAIYIIIFYVTFFVVLYGGVWVTRRISKSLRRRRDIKRLRESLKDRPINYKQMEGLTKRT